MTRTTVTEFEGPARIETAQTPNVTSLACFVNERAAYSGERGGCGKADE